MRRVLPARIVRAWRNLLPDTLLIPSLKLARVAVSCAPKGPLVVLTSGPPHIVHLVGLLLKLTRTCTWIADFRDLWMDDPAHRWAGWYQARLGRATERAVLRRADVVMTVSPTWVDTLRAKGGRAPVVLIRNAADTDERLPPPERPWPTDVRVLLFAGTQQTNNETDELWEGIRRYVAGVAPGKPGIRFVFLGLSQDIRERLARFQITEHVEDIGPQPFGRAIALLQGADGALVPIKTMGTPASKGTIPAKLYQALALQKHVVLLADPDGDAVALLRDHKHDFAAGDDPEAIAAAFSRFADRAATSRTGAPPKAGYWSREASAAALDKVIRAVTPE